VDNVSEVERRIRVLEVIDAEAGRARTLRVFCIRTGRTVDVEGCRTCPDNVHIRSESVTCGVPEEPERAGANTPAALVSVAHVMCARADARAAALVSVIQPPWLIPLVDDVDRFVGFVSSSSLATSMWPSRVAILMRLRDLAYGSSLMIHESTTIREALHMMAYRRTRWIAIVDSDGKLQGMLSDIDALSAIGTIARP
jgi:CBS domain-containing protein